MGKNSRQKAMSSIILGNIKRANAKKKAGGITTADPSAGRGMTESKRKGFIVNGRASDLYRKEIEKIDLLSLEEEIALARELRELEETIWAEALKNPDACSIAEKTLKVKKLEPIALRKADQNRTALDLILKSILLDEAMTAAAKRATEIRKRFVEANLRIVISIARRYVNKGLEFEDLLQEGNIGLIGAIGRYDHTKGVRFATYASWWMRQNMGRALTDKGRPVRISSYLYESMAAVRKARIELGQSATDDDVKAHLKMSDDTFNGAISAISVEYVELDKPERDNENGAGRSSNFRNEELIGSGDSEDASEILCKNELLDSVSRLAGTLSEKELEVIRRHFGFGNHAEGNFSDIGAAMGISRQRAWQLKEDALCKLRAAAIEQGITGVN